MHVNVIGAGLSGLVAARTLLDCGHSVTVLDKGRSAGGRCATRRIGDAVVDHGAQFFTVRDETFSSMVRQWQDSGVVREWCRGFAEHDGHPRFCGVGGMTTIAKYLARGIDVRYEHMAFGIDQRNEGGWRVTTDDGGHLDADAVVVTCPLPQAMALLVESDLEIPDAIRTIDYDKTIAALVVVDGATMLPRVGALQSPDETFSFIADNKAKGVSPVSALTFHCTPVFSETHWWNDPEQTHQLVMDRARAYLGSARVLIDQHKRWRMATPRTTWPQRSWMQRGIVLAGDAFGGPRIEGAVLSGLAAAQQLAGWLAD